MGEAEEFADALAQVDKLKFAVDLAGSDIEVNKGAKSGAVHVAKVGEIKHDPPGAGQDAHEFLAKLLGVLGGQTAGTADHNGVRRRGSVQAKAMDKNWRI